jgi:NCAIR mutase (PurE)-related protein
MNRPEFERLLSAWKQGELTVDEAFDRWQATSGPTAVAKAALVDLDRADRCGYAEVVYGPGKSIEQLLEVFQIQELAGQSSLATRLSTEQLDALEGMVPGILVNRLARTARRQKVSTTDAPSGQVAILTAGTTDLPVAEEAAETVRWMGGAANLVFDVGVAGPHRLVEKLSEFQQADVVIVVAGMEGALPSVAAGWVRVPVIAVPTSVGYGANFGGVSALLSMLNSCAANVCVVNIDAGFKAGYLAGLIANRSRD